MWAWRRCSLAWVKTTKQCQYFASCFLDSLDWGPDMRKEDQRSPWPFEVLNQVVVLGCKVQSAGMLGKQWWSWWETMVKLVGNNGKAGGKVLVKMTVTWQSWWQSRWEHWQSLPFFPSLICFPIGNLWTLDLNPLPPATARVPWSLPHLCITPKPTHRLPSVNTFDTHLVLLLSFLRLKQRFGPFVLETTPQNLVLTKLERHGGFYNMVGTPWRRYFARR